MRPMDFSLAWGRGGTPLPSQGKVPGNEDGNSGKNEIP